MKKILLLLIFFPTMIYPQGITFQIEKLEKPEKTLPEKGITNIYEDLILSDTKLTSYELKKNKIEIPFNIVASKAQNDKLVHYDYHSFFTGMYQAYADHRPFVLSPDIIWLLISQGFAHHVNNNSEEMRKYFTNFEGKKTLIVNNNQITLDNPEAPWETVFPEFTKQMAAYTGDELINTLSADFSTTTPISKVASEITIMNALKPYFQFVVIYIVCGIPEVTLEGTPEDWEKVLQKTLSLKKYELDWWVNELEPLLKEFVKASKGDVDKGFWRNMFKYHTEKEYGAPKKFDGWIVRFFPYDNKGKRNDLKTTKGFDALPNEIVKVDLEYIKLHTDGTSESTPLELWSGFVGLQQNHKTFALKPEIGWMIRKKNTENKALTEKLRQQADEDGSWFSGIHIRVDKVPAEILELKKIKSLRIDFIDSINIPDEMKDMEIKKLYISGKPGVKEVERLRKMFPNTRLWINGEMYDELDNIQIPQLSIPPSTKETKKL